MDESQRKRVHSALETHFRRTRWPRSMLSLIVVLTGYVGFLVSHMLLHFGEVKMWIRYPTAVTIAYAAFLGMLRVWAEFERRHIDLQQANSMVLNDPPRNTSRSGSSGWLDWLDLSDVFLQDGCGEGCVFVLVAIMIIGTVAFLVSSAPELIADVFIDAVLMTMLYRHLKTAARQHWLGTAIRRTWIAALLIALALSAAGGMVQSAHPKARSIGDIWRQYGK